MENTQDQQVKESSNEQVAQTTESAETVDYEALYKAEIANSKKLRKRSQDAEAQLEANAKAQTEAQEAKLIEEGKLKELLEKRDAELKSLKAKANEYDAMITSERESILNAMSEEDKEVFGNLPLKELKALNAKLNSQKPAQQTNQILTGMAKSNTVSNKNYADMTENERKAWHAQVLSGKK